MKRPFELIEHTADIFVKAYGDTVADAFASIAEAMFQLVVDDSPIALPETREFSVEAMDRESLLVQFLSALITMHDIENLVFGSVTVTLASDTSLRCTAQGERFDERKHKHGLMIKAVSYHLLEITEPSGQSPASVKVLFDI